MSAMTPAVADGSPLGIVCGGGTVPRGNSSNVCAAGALCNAAVGGTAGSITLSIESSSWPSRKAMNIALC